LIAYGDGEDQVGDLWRPDRPGPWPVAVLLHGGYWRARWGRDLMDGLAADLAGRGIAAWNLEYRRVGAGGGWPATFDDVEAGLDAVADLDGVDPGRVALVGHSAGGHLALWVASRRGRVRPRVVVALAPVADLSLAHRLRLSDDAAAELLGGPESALPDRYRSASPTALVPLGVRQVLVHGTHDQDVPIALSRSHHAAAVAAGDDCTLLELPGVDHMTLIDPAAAPWSTAVRHL